MVPIRDQDACRAGARRTGRYGSGEAEGDLAGLLRPAADGVLGAWPISTRVNAPRNNTPDLLDELEPSFVD